MAVKKSDLYASLWASCDALRGGMDASNYKNYVLVLLFLKYISDKYAGQPYAAITVPPGSTFADLANLKGKSDLGDQINKTIISPLVKANTKLNLADFPDFNDGALLGTGKEKVDRLTKLIAIFQDPKLDFSKNRADHDDLLGDAYEYLIRHFATESGKSKGQFYTPAEVSRTIAQLIGIGHAKTTAKTTVYDPTCGSGSLLLKVSGAARPDAASPTLYGQEKDAVTSGLARMNMILHDCPTADIAQGNTLADPQFKNERGSLKQFDYVVANPPFSDKDWGTGVDTEKDPHGRFDTFGTPPAKQGDYAYLLHILRSLKSTGTGACILPHGVLFRGNAEAHIRKTLVQHGVIQAIIGLPANLFYGTGIPACILVLNKTHAASRRAILMIDASRGFKKDGPKNRLRDRDVHRIVDAQDIAGHLQGGIPAADVDSLHAYWAVCPDLRPAVFADLRPGYFRLAVPAADLNPALTGHPQFAAFLDAARAHFADWQTQAAPTLKALAPGFAPKQVLHDLSEHLLAHYQGQPLIDPYAVYQHLMDYAARTMLDDLYLVASDGWAASAQPTRVLETNKQGKVKDKGWQCDLLPKPLVVARYFAQEQAALDALAADLDRVAAELTELEEEHAGDDGVFDGWDKINAAAVKARLKKLKGQKDASDETAVLGRWQTLHQQQADIKKKIKAADADLDAAALAKYDDLTEADVKALVVDDKWLAVLAASLDRELDRVRQTLTGRVQQLADRYARPLAELAEEAATLEAKVQQHLERMGFSWSK